MLCFAAYLTESHPKDNKPSLSFSANKNSIEQCARGHEKEYRRVPRESRFANFSGNHTRAHGGGGGIGVWICASRPIARSSIIGLNRRKFMDAALPRAIRPRSEIKTGGEYEEREKGGGRGARRDTRAEATEKGTKLGGRGARDRIHHVRIFYAARPRRKFTLN